jgi:hypothetical protein
MRYGITNTALERCSRQGHATCQASFLNLFYKKRRHVERLCPNGQLPSPGTLRRILHPPPVNPVCDLVELCLWRDCRFSYQCAAFQVGEDHPALPGAEFLWQEGHTAASGRRKLSRPTRLCISLRMTDHGCCPKKGSSPTRKKLPSGEHLT